MATIRNVGRRLCGSLGSGSRRLATWLGAVGLYESAGRAARPRTSGRLPPANPQEGPLRPEGARVATAVRPWIGPGRARHGRAAPVSHRCQRRLQAPNGGRSGLAGTRGADRPGGDRSDWMGRGPGTSEAGRWMAGLQRPLASCAGRRASGSDDRARAAARNRSQVRRSGYRVGPRHPAADAHIPRHVCGPGALSGRTPGSSDMARRRPSPPARSKPG